MTPFDLAQLRPSKADCPSDLKLHRLSAGELQGDELESTRRHTETCQDCVARLATMRAGFDAFPEANPQKMLAAIRREGAARAESGRWVKWLRLLLAPVAVAGVATLVVFARPHPEALVADGVRAKGGPVLHVFKKVGPTGQEALSGERFKPGDRLQFEVDLNAESRIQVLGIDAAGQRYSVWPSDDTAVRMLAGKGQSIPGAVELDGSAGTETLYVVACSPEQERPTCVSQGASSAPLCKPGCVVGPFVLHKGP